MAHDTEATAGAALSPRDATGTSEIECGALLASLTEFSKCAGHDMIGPLNQANSLLALFTRKYRHQLDDDADALLEFLQSASARMEGVVSGVRKYMDAASAPIHVATVDLNAPFADALARLGPVISQSCAVIQSDPLPHATADPGAMCTIFEILLGNAIKFRNPETGPHVRISAGPAGEFHAISVADNGIGIEEEYWETAFLPFKRLNGREYPGAGLGLPMAKLIAERHGGRICIRAPGRDTPTGTVVEFTVRRA